MSCEIRKENSMRKYEYKIVRMRETGAYGDVSSSNSLTPAAISFNDGNIEGLGEDGWQFAGVLRSVPEQATGGQLPIPAHEVVIFSKECSA
jgi:hypothetical protein